MSDRTTVKAAMRRIAEELPADADWEDVLYTIHVRRSIEEGLRDIDEGRTYSTEQIRERLDMPVLSRS